MASWQSGNGPKKHSMFQHRHYVALASIFKESVSRDDFLARLIVMFRHDNENFDTERFIKAANDTSKRWSDKSKPIALTFADYGLIASFK
jgi:hypothetical protein